MLLNKMRRQLDTANVPPFALHNIVIRNAEGSAYVARVGALVFRSVSRILV